MAVVEKRHEILAISSSEDIVRVRQAVRAWVVELGFSMISQTKLVTAASELARNTLEFGGGGTVRLEILSDSTHTGIRLTFEDHGPGIPDIELALKDGYTTGNGLGLGLGGARRLVNEFQIDSQVGRGTRVSIIRWK
jgi:serine/threonine-protein kinase RsbT